MFVYLASQLLLRYHTLYLVVVPFKIYPQAAVYDCLSEEARIPRNIGDRMQYRLKPLFDTYYYLNVSTRRE